MKPKHDHLLARLLQLQDTMPPLVKIGLVVGGYVIALAVAAAAATYQMVATSGPGTQGSSGMNAFAECLLFLAVFGIAAVPATGAALFFLRPFHAFWRVLSVVALVLAFTSLAAFIAWAVDSVSTVGGLAFFRILVAPLFALAFLVSCAFAPNRAARIGLFVATIIEAAGFVGWLITCIIRNY